MPAHYLTCNREVCQYQAHEIGVKSQTCEGNHVATTMIVNGFAFFLRIRDQETILREKTTARYRRINRSFGQSHINTDGSLAGVAKAREQTGFHGE